MSRASWLAQVLTRKTKHAPLARVRTRPPQVASGGRLKPVENRLTRSSSNRVYGLYGDAGSGG